MDALVWVRDADAVWVTATVIKKEPGKVSVRVTDTQEERHITGDDVALDSAIKLCNVWDDCEGAVHTARIARRRARTARTPGIN